MVLTNLILSSLFAFDLQMDSSLDGFPAVENGPVVEKVEEHPAFNDEQIAKALEYVQSFDLVFQDIYVYTKPALYSDYVSGGQSYYANELNPVANLFFKNNLWDAAFVSANILNYYMFNNKYLSTVYSIALDVIEVWAISTWQPTTTRQINVSAILYEQMF